MAASEESLRQANAMVADMIPKLAREADRMQGEVGDMSDAIKLAAVKLHAIVDEWEKQQLGDAPVKHAANVAAVMALRPTLKQQVADATTMVEVLQDYRVHADAVVMLAAFPALQRGAAWHLARQTEATMMDDEVKTTRVEVRVADVETAIKNATCCTITDVLIGRDGRSLLLQDQQV